MKKTCLILLLFGVLLAACSPKETTLTVMTHDSFAISESVLAVFEQEHHVRVNFLLSGDSGAALNKAILTREAPLADVFFGVDNTFLSRALDAGIFESYTPARLGDIPAGFILDPEHRLLPVDYGDVCINYHRGWFIAHNLPVPDSLEDLLLPEYTGLLVVENPATSSPGLAFLLATIAYFGEEAYLSYWEGLRQNGVTVVDGWETAYYTNFSGSSGHGPQPLVVSYATSPAAEVIFADPPVDIAPTASITAPGTCYRQIEFIGILAGTRQRALAQAFVDFMLSTRVQEDIPLQMFVYPVHPAARLPEEFLRWSQAAQEPAMLDPHLIAARRERWISDWTATVLR